MRGEQDVCVHVVPLPTPPLLQLNHSCHSPLRVAIFLAVDDSPITIALAIRAGLG